MFFISISYITFYAIQYINFYIINYSSNHKRIYKISKQNLLHNHK